MRPLDVGEGDMEEHVFYYDKEEGKCLPFTYKGEGGNRNRFPTVEECEEKCVKRREEERPKRKPHTPSSQGMTHTDKGI